jgi:hypothetical protein
MNKTENKRGFSLYLTFLVTTVIFILVSGSYEIGRISLDLGKSSAADVLLFHAADGGLERGLARTRKNFSTFEFSYVFVPQQHRTIKVTVQATKKNDKIDLLATAILFEGNKLVAQRSLLRQGVEAKKGRNGQGNFMEAS